MPFWQTSSGSGGLADVQPGVDMGHATEVGDHAGPFELPDIPDFILADILVLVEGEGEVVYPARPDVFQGLLGILLASMIGVRNVGLLVFCY